MSGHAEPRGIDRYERLIDSITDYAIYMLDADGLITSWNVGARRLLGYTADEIIGSHFSKLYTREDRIVGTPSRALEATLRDGRYETEGWRARKDGSRFWASVVVDVVRRSNGQLEGFAKVTRDITERRAQQEALRESEQQFRLLVAGVTDYALFMLDPNGIITSWNAGATRIKGYTAQEIIGHHFSRFYTERDRAAGGPAHALNTAAREGRFEAEGWRVRKDGTMFWANAVIDRIHSEQGALIGFAKITRDITERREADRSLQRALAKRAQTQKMEALGQLTGGVAHDFNNLLMVIDGHLATIKQGVSGDAKMLHAIEAISYAALRGETLTRQLLTFARRQAVNPTVISFVERFDTLRSLIESSIGGKITLIAAVESGAWPVKVDVSELELAIINIAVNARDAMPDGGTITITTENVTLSQDDTSEKLEGDFVALRVTDTGTGIAPDVLPKVFDPFFTTKPADKGTGLGLSQVHGFAHQSHGTVVIESVLGKGTTVTLYLPRAYETPATAPPELKIEHSCGGLVLVVEDNPNVAEVTVSMLEELGYEAQLVSGPQAALEALEGRDFSLVVSDIVMPGSMNGIALARAIRKRKPATQIILVTGYTNIPEDLALEFPLIRKPLRLPQLRQVVADLATRSKQSPMNIVGLHDSERPSIATPKCK